MNFMYLQEDHPFSFEDLPPVILVELDDATGRLGHGQGRATVGPLNGHEGEQYEPGNQHCLLYCNLFLKTKFLAQRKKQKILRYLKCGQIRINFPSVFIFYVGRTGTFSLLLHLLNKLSWKRSELIGKGKR
jgi:hypothetical protein